MEGNPSVLIEPYSCCCYDHHEHLNQADDDHADVDKAGDEHAEADL